FVTNEDAKRRVLAMGEDPKYVFNTGSLDVELASRVDTLMTSERVNRYGVGHDVDLAKPFLMVVQHPVTTETDNRVHLETTLSAQNVAHVAYDARAIRDAVEHQMRHGRYPSSHIYFQPDASQQIADRLTAVELYTQKRFFDAASVSA